jgi:hypothetical protein
MWVFHYRGRIVIVCQPLRRTASRIIAPLPANFGHYGELQANAKIFFFRPIASYCPYPGQTRHCADYCSQITGAECK